MLSALPISTPVRPQRPGSLEAWVCPLAEDRSTAVSAGDDGLGWGWEERGIDRRELLVPEGGG
ncbi:MAG: hypothetical protein R3253_09095, partial [Longimicrobiales bacterium]|nr:hypothetical protein [Longimicrobiales bacterium]